jgi:hypothetical protein
LKSSKFKNQNLKFKYNYVQILENVIKIKKEQKSNRKNKKRKAKRHQTIANNRKKRNEPNKP